MLASALRMKIQFTRAELEEAERRLRAQLDSAVEQRDQLEATTLEPTGDPDGQQSDEGTEDASFERDRGALEAEDALVDEVREALDRVAAGTYGLCESCERPIEKARLAVLPHARTCSSCAGRAEAAGAA
jgi:RNA polymerase-binding transcription factor DksA